MGRPASSHLLIVSVKAACIVCFSMCGEELADLRINFISIVRASFFSHSDAAVRLQRTFERFVCLETDDFFLALVQISRTMRSNGRNYLCVHIKNAACFTFFFLQIKYLCPQIICCLRRACQEGFISLIRSIVPLDEVTDIDFIIPFSAYKICPFWSHFE